MKNKKKNKTIDQIVDDLVIDTKREDNITEANKEMFIPNEKKYKKRKIFLILLSVFIIGLIILLAIQCREKIDEPIIKETESNTHLTMNKLAKILPLDSDYSITLTSSNKINSSKIKWVLEDEKVLELNNCSKLMCNVTAKSVGEAKLKAIYDDDSYAEMIIKVVENQKIYIFEEEYNDETYLWTSFDLDDIDQKPSYIYTCKSIDCKILDLSDKNLLIEEDNSFYYYNVVTNTKKIIDLPLNDYETVFMVEGANNKVIGLVLDDNNYYSLSKKEVIISSNDDSEHFLLYCGLVNDNKILLSSYDNKTTRVYSLIDGSLIKTFNKYLYYFHKVIVGSETYYFSDKGEDEEIFLLLNDNLTVLMDDVKDFTYDNNYMYLITSSNKKSFDKYDANLNYVESSREYSEVYNFYDNYFIALNENKELVLMDFNENLIHTFTTLNDDTFYDGFGESDQLIDGKSAIIVYVFNKNYVMDNDYIDGDYYYYIPSTGEYGELDDGGYEEW